MDKLVFPLVLALAYCIYRLHIHSQADTLKNHVTWCVSKDSHIRANLSLWDYACNAQIEHNLPQQYRLTDNERSDANLILSAYQQELTEWYFAGLVKPKKEFSRLRGEDYFMLSLCDYLKEHECDLFLGDKKKYSLVSRKDYGMWGGPLYDAEYELTDFGRIYQKLCYIAVLCTTENPDGWLRKGHEEILNTNHIKISRM